jgi:hypothetical protein
MHTSSTLPRHIRDARWIGPEEKDDLTHGFYQLSPDQQEHALNACFDCGRTIARIYVLAQDERMRRLLESFTD